jgi:hypothetical protein
MGKEGFDHRKLEKVQVSEREREREKATKTALQQRENTVYTSYQYQNGQNYYINIQGALL